MKTTECHRLSESLTAYLDGELSEGERREVEQGLERFEELRQDLQSHRKAREIVHKAAPAMAIEASFWEGVEREIRGGFRQPEPRPGRQAARSRLWRWIPVTALGGLALVLALTLPVFNNPTDNNPAAEARLSDPAEDARLRRAFDNFVRARQRQETIQPAVLEWAESDENPFRKASYDLDSNPFAGE